MPTRRRELPAARNEDGGSNGRPPSPPVRFRDPASPPPGPPGGVRPRLKKLRVALVLLGLFVLAFVSWIFGIMMAVAQDLPALEAREQYKHAENSIVYDIDGDRIATLTGNQARILVASDEISPAVKQAVVAVEDERFYEHRGIDFEGIGRAVVQDILSREAAQGGSTITQQFVKNALRAQQDRTIFQKLREAGLAYHLEREWSKDKILTEYLNSIYFGEGAYGIEAAARTYFGYSHPGCGQSSEMTDPTVAPVADTGDDSSCASQLLPYEAALLAGMISSPSAYSPRSNREAALQRRNLVLQKMVDQGTLTQEEYDDFADEPVPSPSQIESPKEDSVAPYFTSWLRQQVVDHYGAGQAFGGGLHIYSTLDLQLQQAAQEVVDGRLSGLGITGAVVVIDNATGGVRAMVGGSDYEEAPFNLATNGRRQPGSAFKPFTLVTALEQGHATTEVFASQPKEIPFEARVERKDGTLKTVTDLFRVNNYEDSYYGSLSLAQATTYSDNSIYAELGHEVGEENVAETAHEMGIETELSTNPAMILGGLEQGVSPLEMAYAYTTLARAGRRLGGTLDSASGGALGPLAISKVEDAAPGDGDAELVKANDAPSGQNQVKTEQVVPESVATTAVDVLETVITSGTGRRAAIGDFAWGKTGTTENNGDAWFCGGTELVTACVWVGHAEGNTPMETEFGGGPVDGGTFPALIWHEVISAFLQLQAQRQADEKSEAADAGYVPSAPAPTSPAPEPAPTEPAPAEPEAEAPAPAEDTDASPPTPPAGEDGGGGGSSGGGTNPG